MTSTKRKLTAESASTKSSNKRPKSDSHVKHKTDDLHKKKIKEGTGQTAEDPKQKQVSLLTKEQPAFPRGGANLLTPLERKQIEAKAVLDAEREFRSGRGGLFDAGDAHLGEASDEDDGLVEPRTRKTPKKSTRTKGTAAESVGGNSSAELKISGLGYKRITGGSLILGQIVAIGLQELTVALPNNLVGYVPLTSVSAQLNEKIQGLLSDTNEDEENEGHQHDQDRAEDDDQDIVLTDYFTIGQYVRVAVTSTGQDDAGGKSVARKRLELSLDPALTNVGLGRSSLAAGCTVQVAVSSVEDHGAVVDLALEEDKVRGFIPQKELPHSLSLSDVKTGAVYLCRVVSIGSNGKIVKLSADLSRRHVVKDAPSIDAFLPGTVADILVTEKTESGLAGKVMGLLDVTADVVHSGSYQSKEAFMERYKVGKKIQGRIICSFPLSEVKKMGFSVLDHLLDLKETLASVDSIPTKVAISSIVPEATVIRVEPGLGIYLALPEGVVGFAHISRLSDQKVDSISETSGTFKTGSQHTVRITDFNPVDGLYLVSLQQSVLDQPFLRVQDVPVGGIVKGHIEKLLIGPSGVQGIIVNLAQGVSGLVPQTHMSDVNLQHPERKFREGQAVTARVLSTDPAKRQLRLTLKKTLVNSDQKIWSRFEDIEVGDSTVGTLVKVESHGALVQFYGPVRGFLPVSEMSEAYIKDATEHFRLGQVVSVTAISVNAEDKRLTVSCRDLQAMNPSVENTLASLQPGTLAAGVVFEKSQNDLLMRLEGSDAIARLTVDHVCDGSARKRESALSKIRVGQRLEDVLILDVQPRRRLAVMCNRRSLIKAAQTGTLLKSYEDLRPDALVTGYVSNITSDGVFITFAAGISGLVTRRQVAGEAEDEPDFGMTKFQPVTAKVLGIDYKGAKPRFWLTMRDLSTTPTAQPSSASGSSDLTDPVDENLQSLGDLAVGRITQARIVSVKDTQLNVELAKDVQGRVDVSEVFDQWEDIKDRRKPLRQFSPKQVIAVKVLGAHDTRNHRFLPLTHRSGKNTVYELTSKRSSLTGEGERDIITLAEMAVGSSWIAFVNNILDGCLWVNISPRVRGRIRALDVSDDLTLAADLEKNFPIGSALRVQVLAVDADKNRLDLTARADGKEAPDFTLQHLSQGLILPGRVTKVSDHRVIVQLSNDVVGVVDLIDMADDYSEVNPAIYQKNEMVRVCVIDVDLPNKKVSLSTRPSKVLSSSMKVVDPEITSIDQLAVNDVYRGFICNVADQGVFVTLGHGITAFVRVSHLSDAYLKDWKEHFQRDQLVKGKVILVDPASGHVHMSFKESVLRSDYTPPLTFHDLHVGDIVTGKVVKVETFGVFILVDNSENVRGLCHRSEIAEQRVADASKLFGEGDLVKAKVLKIEPENRKVNFGMKASYLAGDDAEDGSEASSSTGSAADDGDESDVEDLVDDGGAALVGDDAVEEAVHDESREISHGREDGSEREDSDQSEDEDEKVARHDSTKVNSNGLKVGGFDWYGISETKASSKRPAGASDTEDEQGVSVARHKKKRRRSEIQVDRTGDLDTAGPQSVDDYERLLLSEPDSSLLWLQYMAFHLDLGDADQARQIGERALKTIGLGQDGEKMNVWVALLNLENAYGDDETIEAVFQRACEYNDPQEIFSRLTSIYIQSGQPAKADALFHKMIKRFAQDPKVWINYATFLFNTVADADQARALLPRALQTLPKFTHFDVTLKFAHLEFKTTAGLPERGRTIFEGLISSFPKRIDLFDVLLDLELKLGDKEQIRALFERIFGGRLKPKQAKHFFKRWLAFEELEGDERRVEEVKARAAIWIREAGKETA